MGLCEKVAKAQNNKNTDPKVLECLNPVSGYVRGRYQHIVDKNTYCFNPVKVCPLYENKKCNAQELYQIRRSLSII